MNKFVQEGNRIKDVDYYNSNHFLNFENNFSELFLSLTSSISNIGFSLNSPPNNLSFIFLILVIIGGSFCFLFNIILSSQMRYH